MKQFLLLFFPVTMSLCSAAQEIQFLTSGYDFGKIKEMDGPVEHVFKFKNTGKDTLIISEVKPSCGCTTTGWTKEPVAPDDTGFVRASFNPYNRPGTFSKSMMVLSNALNTPVTLSFTGFVEAKQKTLGERFPEVKGKLRFESAELDLGRITTYETGSNKAFKVYNADKQPIVISKLETPDYITIEFPEKLNPQQDTMFSITYDPDKRKEYGPVRDPFVFYTSDEPDVEKKLFVKAEIVEGEGQVSEEQLEQLPVIEVNRVFIDFDTIQSGNTPVEEFEIKNVGKKDLILRRLYSPVSNIVLKTEKKTIKPGGKANTKVMYQSSGLVGKEAKTIVIYSNDPKSPATKISVKAEVVK